MTAKEFAETYAGRKVSFGSIVGRVVGYTNDGAVGNYVAIETATPGYRWARTSHNGTITTWLCDDATHGYWINADQLKLIDAEPEVKAPIVKPYPSTCKICKAPARKCSSLVMCSNTKCKSRKLLKATYKHVRPVVPSEGTYTLKCGKRYFPDVWKSGGCAICGWSVRDNNTWAHDDCWNSWKGSETSELIMAPGMDR